MVTVCRTCGTKVRKEDTAWVLQDATGSKLIKMTCRNCGHSWTEWDEPDLSI
jgi:ribosomal protein S27E